MGWRSDREDYLAAHERRSFGVLTQEEVWAIAVLSGEWPPGEDGYDASAHHRARPIARAALARVAPDIGDVGTRRDLLEERDALRTRLALVESALRSET